MSSPSQNTPTPSSYALADEIFGLERHVATSGWDAPIRIYALVQTALALLDTPSLVEEIPPEAVERARSNPHALLAIEQEGLPESENLEDLLAQLAWPETVHGVAVAVERVVVPKAAEAELPEDPEAQLEALMNHPQRDDVRIVAGVLRTGETWCALRYRSHDEDDKVASSSDAVPGLFDGLRATLA